MVVGHINFGRGLPRCVGRDSEGSSSTRWYGGAVPDPSPAARKRPNPPATKARSSWLKITSPFVTRRFAYCFTITTQTQLLQASVLLPFQTFVSIFVAPNLVGADLSDCSHQYSIIGLGNWVSSVSILCSVKNCRDR